MALRTPLSRRLVRALAPVALLAVVGLAVAGCGGSSSSTSDKGEASPAITEVSAGTITSAGQLELPAKGGTVITLAGFGATNAADGLQLSIAQLEQMRTVKATVYEPFLKRNVEFQGVELQDLLDLAELPVGTKKIDSVAYNEYAVTLPTSILDHSGVILATRADGQLIPLDKGGPTRIVFTDDHPDTENQSLWIWSTKTLTVK